MTVAIHGVVIRNWSVAPVVRVTREIYSANNLRRREIHIGRNCSIVCLIVCEQTCPAKVWMLIVDARVDDAYLDARSRETQAEANRVLPKQRDTQKGNAG